MQNVLPYSFGGCSSRIMVARTRDGHSDSAVGHSRADGNLSTGKWTTRPASATVRTHTHEDDDSRRAPTTLVLLFLCVMTRVRSSVCVWSQWWCRCRDRRGSVVATCCRRDCAIEETPETAPKAIVTSTMVTTDKKHSTTTTGRRVAPVSRRSMWLTSLLPGATHFCTCCCEA